MQTTTAVRTGVIYPHRLLTTLDDDTRRRLGAAAEATQRPLTFLVRQAIAEWLDRHHPTTQA
jgi:predicted transcriptional regulator